MSVDEELRLLCERLHSVQLQIDALNEAKCGLESAILERRSEGEIELDSKSKVRIKPPGKRFNEKRAREEAPPEVLARCVDFSAKAFRKLDPDLYETFREPSGSPTVEIIND